MAVANFKDIMEFITILRTKILLGLFWVFVLETTKQQWSDDHKQTKAAEFIS